MKGRLSYAFVGFISTFLQLIRNDWFLQIRRNFIKKVRPQARRKPKHPAFQAFFGPIHSH
jgi:hypothetical protein